MAQSVRCTWDGFEMIHRFEDLEVIASVIRERQPMKVIELGTAHGGFAAFLADTVKPWGGMVLSIDKQHDPAIVAALKSTRENLTLMHADALSEQTIMQVLAMGRHQLMVYCDNGNKELELRLWGRKLQPGTIGTHDYGTEVDPEPIERFMTSIGYQPYRHADFERLAHPEWYPISMTRFWVRP